MNRIFFLITLSFMVSCKKESTENNTTSSEHYISVTKEQFASNQMALDSMKKRDFPETIETAGKLAVQPIYSAKISAPLAGYLKNIPFKVGDYVNKGQSLLQVESNELLDIQKEYAQLYQQLRFLKSEFDRQKTLWEENISSQKNFLKAESDYKTTLAMTQNLKSKLSAMGVSISHVENGKFSNALAVQTPVSGYIIKINTSPGAFVAATDVLIEVADWKQMQVELKVFEKDFAKITLNQPIEFQLSNNAQVFKSQVVSFEKSVNESDRSIAVYGSLEENMKKQLALGMMLQAKIFTGTSKAVSLPTEAIYQEGKNQWVLLLQKEDPKNYYFLPQKVKVKNAQENFTSIDILPNQKMYLVKGAAMLW
ncbi:MAG: efflux RND transporter periplasmic adaptor subunit [Flavobacteriales bacterium]|nr:efflux RND transporter periplasmic adaptor subunit [Flavobacteriales bacterium]